MLGRALEFLAALVVALEGKSRKPAACVLNAHRINCLGDAAAMRRLAGDAIPRDQARAIVAGRPHERQLRDIARRLTGIAGNPPVDWISEAAAWPPRGILPRQMQSAFKSADAPCLADAVRCDDGTFLVLATRREELHMLAIEVASKRSCIRIKRKKPTPILPPLDFLQNRDRLALRRVAERVELAIDHRFYARDPGRRSI